ncbi:MAG: hypothetical protein ABIV50_03985 [Opitutus sp.]
MASTSTQPTFTPPQWRQVGIITGVALAIFALFRWLPTGTTLSHMDFRMDAKNSIEFCDPLNPQFIPVVAVASPVSLTLESAPAQSGQPVEAKVTLRTASGKPIESQDLLVVHTRRLHLLIVDPTLSDYQHVHPEPAGKPGEWSFRFIPRASGAYRVFADFTPAATNRGLYANADLNVSSATDPAAATETKSANDDSTMADYRFALTPASRPLRAKQVVDLKFTIVRRDGAVVPLQPVMDAFAHLVAFDEMRSGFAHLHPLLADPMQPPDRTNPALNFKITIPSPGRYVIWAQVNLGGREMFVPFWFDVVA